MKDEVKGRRFRLYTGAAMALRRNRYHVEQIAAVCEKLWWQKWDAKELALRKSGIDCSMSRVRKNVRVSATSLAHSGHSSTWFAILMRSSSDTRSAQ